MLESKRTAALRLHLKQHLYTLKLNVRFYKGVPDCYYSGAVADLWNEHKKYDDLPRVIDLTKPSKTSLLQQEWLVGRHNEGRNVGMIVFSNEGHLFLPRLSWQQPMPRDEFIERAHKNYKSLAAELIELLGPLEEPPIP